MGICWYCYWGWSKPVAEIHDRYEAIAGEDAMHYGPAHVVWDDENWDCAQSCLDDFDDWVRDWNKGRYTQEQLEAVRQSLIELAALPGDVREVEPDNYDDEHPELYPPKVKTVHR